MTCLLQTTKSENVRYMDASGNFHALHNLMFCRYGKVLRSEESCDVHIEGYVCPQTLSGMPKTEGLMNRGESSSSWCCPCCTCVLKLKSVLNQEINSNLDESEIKKLFYLSCPNCRWSSRDVKIPDHETINAKPWEKNLNLHENYYVFMKNFMQVDMTNFLKNSEDRENKIQNSINNANKKNVNTPKLLSDNPLSNILANRFGSKFSGNDALAKLKARQNTQNLASTKDPKFQEPFKIPTIPEPLKHLYEPIEVDYRSDQYNLEKLSKMSDVETVTCLKQRFLAPQSQPMDIIELRPIPGQLISQNSLKYDGHRLLRPDYNAVIIKPKIRNIASQIIPNIEILRNFNKKNSTLNILVSNPIYRPSNLFLLPFHLKEELTPGEITRNKIDITRVAEIFVLPTEQIELAGSIESHELEGVSVHSDPTLLVHQNQCKIEIKCDISKLDGTFDWFWLPLRLKFDYVSAALAPLKNRDSVPSPSTTTWLESKVIIRVDL